MGADPATLAAIGLGAGQLFSSREQSKAAEEAAQAGSQAANQAAQVQREALQQYRLASEPFRFGGQQAINPLLSSLGITPFQMPQQPAFNMLTGAPMIPPDQAQTRLEELKRLRDQMAPQGQSVQQNVISQAQDKRRYGPKNNAGFTLPGRQ